ncbi:MAG: hydrolase [Isosphaeraceae bacterium]
MSVPDRLDEKGGALLIVDVQEKLLAQIARRRLVVANSVRLVRAAQALEMPFWATEQYPKGLGPTVAELAELIPQRPDKVRFDCCSIPSVPDRLQHLGVRHVALAGIETHVCVAQTALELLRLGYLVQIPADAVASRHEPDWEFALRRLERAGAIVTTTEAILFEWIGGADHPRFKIISDLIKSFDPSTYSIKDPLP